MKHIFTFLAAAAAALALTSCEDKKNQPWDPNAMISLRPDIDKAAQAPTKANPEHLTPLEIVKQATTIYFYNKTIQEDILSRSFADVQRDFIAPRLLMWGTDIISSEGKYVINFVKGEDMVVVRVLNEETNPVVDTIAYIPNAVLRDADKAIKAAYDKQDYETCYRLFDEAFVFRPITGAEWRELKARGEN